MDRGQTNDMLERCRRFGTEMEAFGQGIAIQVKAPSCWINEFNPSWNLHCEYRVKPKPRTVWVACGAFTSNLTWQTKEECDENYPGDGWESVKFVEEIE